jgi:hypothetical protein
MAKEIKTEKKKQFELQWSEGEDNKFLNVNITNLDLTSEFDVTHVINTIRQFQTQVLKKMPKQIKANNA